MTDRATNDPPALLLATDRLLQAIDAAIGDTVPPEQRGRASEDRAVIAGYRERLAGGIAAGDVAEQLRAANMLSTVNKGIGDAVWTASAPEIGDLAYSLYGVAIDVAEHLRASG